MGKEGNVGIIKLFVISFPCNFFRNEVLGKKKSLTWSDIVLGIDILNGTLTVSKASPNELIQQVWPFHLTKIGQKI